MERKEIVSRIKELLDSVDNKTINVSKSLLAELILTTVEESQQTHQHIYKRFRD